MRQTNPPKLRTCDEINESIRVQERRERIEEEGAVELQKFADQTGLTITVAHHPPGTSKWNRIEHRMFAFISQNWRGKPLLSHKVIVQLIAATKTASGVTISCAIDAARYPKGDKISDAQLEALNIRYDAFHPDWNYSFLPRRPASRPVK